MSFLSSLFGSKPKTKQLPAISPQQQAFLNQLLQLLGNQGITGGGEALSYLQELLSGTPESTEAFTAPYMRQFYEQTIPNIAERFTSGGGQRSSAFQNALGQAGAGLQEQLAALRAGLQTQAAGGLISGLQGLGGLGLGMKPFGYSQSQGSPGLFGNIGQAFGSTLGGLGSIGLGRRFGILS